MTYTIQYNNDGTVTISEEAYEKLREKAANYDKLLVIASRAILDAIKNK